VINIHPIQQLILDLQFIGIKESNNYLFDKASNLSNNRISSVLSNFFDDLRFSELHFEFQTLDLDLGVIPYEQFEDKFIEKLIEAITLKFKDVLENSKNDYVLKDTVQNYYEIIKYYLLNGRLPWWSTKFHNNNIKSIFDEFIIKHPQQFRTLLYEIGGNENVRKRLAYSLPMELVKNIIKILQPSEFEYFFTYHDYIIDINKKEKFINESESDLSKAIWFNILSYILSDSSSVFEKKEFLKRNIHSIASYYNIEYLKLLSLIYYATINITPTFNSDIYKFSKDIQNIFFEANNENSNVIDRIEYINSIYQKNNKNHIQNNFFNDDVTDQLFILNYYISFGSLPKGFEHYNINDLKNIFNNIFIKDQFILQKFLLNISYNSGMGIRIFNILNSINFKFALDIIIKPTLQYNINDLHKSFIQLLISQNRSTTIYLTDDWKVKLINLVYLNKYSIDYAKIFNLYLKKYATENQISIFTAAEIYYKDLLIQNNQHLINKLLEFKNNIVDEYNNFPLEHEIHNDKGIIDLIKFIIDNGFVPWWGSPFMKNNFQLTVENYLQNNTNDVIYLLSYSFKSAKTKSRFISLLGEDKIYDLLYNLIKNDEDFNFYKYVEQILNLSDNLLIQKSIFINILWETHIEYNYSIFSPNYLLNKIFTYINIISKKSLLNIIENVVNNKLNDKNQLHKNKLIDIINELYIQFSEKNYYQTISLEFEIFLKNNFKIDSSNNSEFENYLNFISGSKIKNQKLHFKNAQLILTNLLYKDIVPVNFNINGNVNINSLIIRIFEYLYLNEKNTLTSIFNNTNEIIDIYKYIITDWIFSNSTIEIAVYISNIFFTYVQDEISYLESDRYNNNKIFYNQNFYDTDFIASTHKILDVDSNSSNTLILDKYQVALNTYLETGKLYDNVDNINKLLKYLIISIHQQKGSKNLLDIFNNNTNNTFKHQLLSLFENANNIKDRQIFNTLIRHSNFNQSIYSDSILNSETIKFNLTQDKTNINIPLYDLVKQHLHVNNLNDIQYFELLNNYFKAYLDHNTKPPILEFLSQNIFEYYLKLLINEIVKKSPSNFYNLLKESNNLKNILYIFDLYTNASQGIELTVQNTITDFFIDYTLIVLKDKLGKNINYKGLQFTNITNDEFKKVISDLLINNKFIELQYILNSKHAIKYFDYKLWLDKYLKNNNIIDKQILQLYINLIIKSVSNIVDKDEINYILNKSFIYLLSNEVRFDNNFHFLENFFNEILNYTNNKSNKILDPIIYYFENLSINQPKQLIELIDYTILKSKAILNSQIVFNIEQKNEKVIKDHVKIIKDTYENDIKSKQDAILKNNQLKQSNNVDDVLKNESIYINNIGLVLFHLFIPTFFNRLNLLNTEGNFLSIECQYRAVHLLQLLVSDATYEEHELVLNKILCNLEIDEIVPMEIEFTDEEKALSLELIGVVIKRWEKMNNSSVGHFRAAFLMRDGRLKLKTDGWYLNVEKRGYDIILSSIPWAFGVIKFKWMHKFLYTEWT
jgi:hypothetical protein